MTTRIPHFSTTDGRIMGRQIQIHPDNKLVHHNIVNQFTANAAIYCTCFPLESYREELTSVWDDFTKHWSTSKLRWASSLFHITIIYGGNISPKKPTTPSWNTGTGPSEYPEGFSYHNTLQIHRLQQGEPRCFSILLLCQVDSKDSMMIQDFVPMPKVSWHFKFMQLHHTSSRIMFLRIKL
jgi:hypothetical protein